LDGHQSVTITQDVAGSGANSAQYAATSSGGCDTSHALSQTQTLTSQADAPKGVTQSENAAQAACPDGNVTDYANMCLDIEQNQGAGSYGVASGTNNATFTQTNTLSAIADSTTGPISQTQSRLNGGLLGTINQDSSGISTASASQTENQCEDAAKGGLGSTCDPADPDAAEAPASLTQVQHGPVKKGLGVSVQSGGNSADTFTINQASHQDTDQRSGSNTQDNTVQGDCSTDGNCTVSQTTNVDGQTSNNTQSGKDVNTQTTCSGSTCTSTGPSLNLQPNGLTVSNADVAEFGVGGMRGNGTGSISVSGVTGPVGGAILYWNGPTNSSDPTVNAAVNFNGMPVTGTNIGIANNNCWGFTNSQSYRADVTPLVTGNGTYSLSNFMKANADINGASLIVFYNDGNSSNDRNFYAWNGNDSNIAFGTDPGGWNETISGVQYPGSGSAFLDTIVSDGQTFDDPALVLNGDNTLAPDGPIFQGVSVPPSVSGGNLWDVESFDMTSFLTTGSNTLNVTSADPNTLGSPPNTDQWDCLSLVVAAANVPAASGSEIFAPVAGPAAFQVGPASRSTPASKPVSHAFVRGGGVG
jgi:hypothetical protein